MSNLQFPPLGGIKGGFNKAILFAEIKDYVWITLGLTIYSVAFSLFLLPYNLVTGGVAGLSALVFYATGIHIQYTYFTVNAILLLIALKVLGWKFMTKTIYATLVLTAELGWLGEMLIDEAGHYPTLLGPDQQFMGLIIGCSLAGIALGIVFLHNGSTGGTDIVAAIINKYKDVSLGQGIIIGDIFIVCSCMVIPQFGDLMSRAHMTVFGLCTMIIETFTLDYFMNSRRQSVQFLIFSKKYQEIANYVGTGLGRGITILDGHGWYSGEKVRVLCILAKKRESVHIFRAIKLIDPNAFVSQSNVIGAYGEGFDPIKVDIKDEKAP